MGLVIVVGSIALLLGILIWWLLVETEGVYLGRKVVIWLYDLYAQRYDHIKEYTPTYEHMLIAHPIMEIIHPQQNPLILDIATGTARLPITMLTHADFQGRVIGVDLSRKMLSEGAYKLAHDLEHVDLLHAPAECLPFADDTFDVVTCLEALEFMSKPEIVIKEAVRVLRPGGLFLTTLRQNINTMPGKIWSEDKMRITLEDDGIERVEFEIWQEDYTKVWGRKPGVSAPITAKTIEAVLRCPTCARIAYKYETPVFKCINCNTQIPVGDDGVLEVFKVQHC